MRRAAARADTENAGHALERVREATGLPEGDAEVEVRDRVRWATGLLVGARGGGTLGGWRPLGCGYDMSGARLADQGRWRWCWVEQ